jgi:uncharacterized protein YndB with AHSA1/START domain
VNSPINDLTLHMNRVFKASPERMFRAWTEPDAIKRWFGPEGYHTISAEVDLRVGGKYRFGTQDTNGTVYYITGTYREIQPPSKLVFTWVWAYELSSPDEEIMLVTVEFAPQGDTTRVLLTHEHVADQQSLEGHKVGWNDCFNRMEQLVS